MLLAIHNTFKLQQWKALQCKIISCADYNYFKCNYYQGLYKLLCVYFV